MQLSEAIALIDHRELRSPAPSRWADLGCGQGLFTRALASFQQAGSTMYAVDTDCQALRTLSHSGSVTIQTLCADFVTDEWPFYELDGILMANSLHYVQDKSSFVRRAADHLNETGSFLIVEYDTNLANPWVPYPLDFHSLTTLFTEVGFTSIEKLRERPSVYGRATMYAASIRK